MSCDGVDMHILPMDVQGPAGSCTCICGWLQVAYMESLKAKGLELFAAYGNTGTDARAYAAAGIPKVLSATSAT